MFKLAVKMTLRDWRAGELRLLLAALALSVAAMSAVGFFTERLRAGMLGDAAQLLAADVLVSSDAPLDASWRAEAAQRGLRTAATVSMTSMATLDHGAEILADAGADADAKDEALPLLVSLKAVEAAYPLRGALALRDGAAAAAVSAPASASTSTSTSTPASGTVWIDPALEVRLNTGVGGRLRIGERVFTIARVILTEPDRRPSPANFAPRVMLAAADLAGTGLLQPGVRARHALLAAGDPAQVAAFESWLRAETAQLSKAQPGRQFTVQTAQEASRDMGENLERAQGFLSLTGLLAAMLAAVAIAMAARRHTLRHLDASAMLRCLGLRQAQLVQLQLIELALVGVAGSALGVLAGYAGHLVLLQLLGDMLPTLSPASVSLSTSLSASLPTSLTDGAAAKAGAFVLAHWRSAAQGMAAGLLLLAGFALPPLLQMRGVTPVRLLRREAGTPRAATLAAIVLGAGMFIALMVWQAGDPMLGGVTALGFLVAGAVFAGVAWLALQALSLLPAPRNVAWAQAWRFAVTSLRRNGGATITQTVALAVGLLALLLLTAVRGELLAQWRATMPPDTPNHFMINVQPDEQQAMARRLQRYGQPMLMPTFRARLLQVNGKAAGGPGNGPRAADETDVDLSSSATLPPASTVMEGAWFASGQVQPEVSVGEGAAKRFGLKLGDKVAFDVGGLPLTVQVSSIRKINWRLRRASFDFVLNAAAAQGLPYTYSGTFYVPEGDRAIGRLARDYPGALVVDIGFIVRQVQHVLAQATLAVEFLFLFTLAAGVLVVYTALAGTQDVRLRQAALLRALGATRSQLARAQWLELALTGALAGLLAAAGASLGGWALARYAFDLTWGWPPHIWLAGLFSGAVCATTGGWLSLRHVLTVAPLQSLRHA